MSTIYEYEHPEFPGAIVRVTVDEVTRDVLSIDVEAGDQATGEAATERMNFLLAAGMRWPVGRLASEAAKRMGE